MVKVKGQSGACISPCMQGVIVLLANKELAYWNFCRRAGVFKLGQRNFLGDLVGWRMFNQCRHCDCLFCSDYMRLLAPH